jgi:hypothetical protein
MMIDRVLLVLSNPHNGFAFILDIRILSCVSAMSSNYAIIIKAIYNNYIPIIGGNFINGVLPIKCFVAVPRLKSNIYIQF